MVAVARCQMEWRVVVEANSIDVGASIKKEVDASMVAIESCPMEWRVVVLISSIDVGASIKKELDALGVVRTRCPMERSVLAVVCGIDVGLLIQKRPNLIQPTPARSLNKRHIQIWLRSHARTGDAAAASEAREECR